MHLSRIHRKRADKRRGKHRRCAAAQGGGARRRRSRCKIFLPRVSGSGRIELSENDFSGTSEDSISDSQQDIQKSMDQGFSSYRI